MGIFLDSPYVRPLFDTVNGGPPLAFKCLLNKYGLWIEKVGQYFLTDPPCGKVTRTEAGMRMHQRRVHGFQEQHELEFTK